MDNIINFNITTQYKFLYIRGKDKDFIYHIWAKTSYELITLANFLKKKNKAAYCIWMNSSCRIKKEFAPIPNDMIKQQDNYYHAYVMIGGDVK